jgi:hypothetical protein
VFEYEIKTKGMTALRVPQIQPAPSNESLTYFTDAANSMSRQVNRALGAGMEVLAPHVVERSNVIGASGGVFALASASVVFSIVFGAQAVVQLVAPRAPKRWGSPPAPRSFSKSLSAILTLVRSFGILSTFLPPLLDNAQYLYSGSGPLRMSEAGHAYGTCVGTFVSLTVLLFRQFR